MKDDTRDLQALSALIRRLRAPDGCPWDREQTVETLGPHLLEEAHEAAAALRSGDWDRIGEELGDLLFQVAFTIELGREMGEIDPGGVVGAVLDKMVARHPHVFGDEDHRPVLESAADVARTWESHKAAARDGEPGVLDGIPASLPALLETSRLTRRAAAVGFDWDAPEPVLEKVREELAELEAEVTSAGTADPQGPNRRRVEEELGDLLFAVANLARHLALEPEGVLAAANAKFRRRFQAVEEHLIDLGRPVGTAGLEEMEAAWKTVKKSELDSPD